MQPLRYINDFPWLPADAATGCPHIVDCKDWSSTHGEDVDTTNLRVPDVVATILYNYNPTALRAFLNVYKHDTFKFLRQELPDSAQRSFVIIRRGGLIICGYCNLHGEFSRRAYPNVIAWQYRTVFEIRGSAMEEWAPRSFFHKPRGIPAAFSTSFTGPLNHGSAPNIGVEVFGDNAERQAAESEFLKELLAKELWTTTNAAPGTVELIAEWPVMALA